jgi:hypothetical protein
MKTTAILASVVFICSSANAQFQLIWTGWNHSYLPVLSSFGDIDNDGNEEFVTQDNYGNIEVFQNGIIEYTFQTMSDGGYAPVLFDFNQDGILDILVSYPVNSNHLVIAGVYSYINNGETVGANDNPPDFKMKPAYPNPFNPTTSIDFTLEQTDNVKLTIHNINGQQVTVLKDGLMERGNHTVDFTASGLASGVYTYTLEVGGFKQTKSFTLVK